MYSLTKGVTAQFLVRGQRLNFLCSKVMYILPQKNDIFIFSRTMFRPSMLGLIYTQSQTGIFFQPELSSNL